MQLFVKKISLNEVVWIALRIEQLYMQKDNKINLFVRQSFVKIKTIDLFFYSLINKLKIESYSFVEV